MKSLPATARNAEDFGVALHPDDAPFLALDEKPGPSTLRPSDQIRHEMVHAAHPSGRLRHHGHQLSGRYLADAPQRMPLE